ncbi:MAG: hypoxanthine phosphoribosyltransferase [Planctomycetaceae bacterium]|nr:hypoxanthine phosphoribosyltransferase [Planctomycetaceae bacterium]
MKVLLTEIEIQAGIEALAKRLDAEYRGRPLTVLGVLTGSLIFLADLIRRMDFPLRVGLIQASSYRGTATLPGALEIHDAGLPILEGRDVLLLDDIFDTGQTLSHLVQHVERQRPHSLRSAVLLWKIGRQRVEITPDYYCFRIPDVFVVGYGLDYHDDYRHLPHVAALDEEDLG